MIEKYLNSSATIRDAITFAFIISGIWTAFLAWLVDDTKANKK